CGARLGIHRAVGQAVAAAKRDGSQLEAPVDEVDAAVRRQWRTCFDSFLSFGFGRPQSTQFESVDDQAFLKARLSHPLPRPGTPASLSLYGDAYIAATARLAHVARSFVLWVEEQEPVGSLDGQSLLSMLSNLNGKLDDWCKLWVWSGSSHALYLGASARIARLQAEHLRLSINAMALRSSTHSDGHESSVTYLRKALNAAKSTIQTHFESSQTDLALSFATDYMTMAFAQAAVFLIRLTKASPLVQQVVSLDPAVVSHYLTMSVDLLEVGDMSETRLSTYFARTIRGISRAAGLAIRPDDSTTIAGVAGDGRGDQPYVPEQSMSLVSADGIGDAGLYDAETFGAGHDPFDLSCVLGLSGVGVAQDTEWLDPALGNLGPFTQPTTPLNMMFGTGEGSV
ncbi:Pc22g00010, partial [Penicillium rubens Wisconsin 54-1255]